jgi:hypothetical protein
VQPFRWTCGTTSSCQIALSPPVAPIFATSTPTQMRGFGRVGQCLWGDIGVTLQCMIKNSSELLVPTSPLRLLQALESVFFRIAWLLPCATAILFQSPPPTASLVYYRACGPSESSLHCTIFIEYMPTKEPKAKMVIIACSTMCRGFC